MLFQHFDWDLTHQVLFLYVLPSHYQIIWTCWETSLEDSKMLIRWCKTDICSCKLSAKVSLMLDNPFLVPFLCKLNHISLCFIQISTKSAYSLQGKQCFFWSHPRCFGPLGKFQHSIKISIKTARVSRLSFRFLWLCPNRHRRCIQLYYQRSNAAHHFHHVSNYFNFHLELLWCSCKLTCNRE